MARRTGKKRHGLIEARSKPGVPTPSVETGGPADAAAQLPTEDDALRAGIAARLDAAASSGARRSPPPPLSPLPCGLQAGIEALSGVSLGDIRVHCNASAPARLQAAAFAQGSGIQLASRPSEHLRPQAWQVARQEQGRVKATPQGKENVLVNESAALEREADMMAERAAGRSRRRRKPL